MAITGPSGFRIKRDFSRVAFWLEPPTITLMGYGLAWLINPDDPLTLQTGFPWLVLTPLLVGLRYGFSAAAFSTVLLTFMGWLYIHLNDKNWQVPGTWILGMLAVSLIAGEFRDIWQRRLKRMEKASQYSQSRMKEFTRSYYLLQHSHAQLEQEVALAGYTLQGAVQDVRSRLLKSSNTERPLKVFGSEFMDVFCEYGNIHSAALLEIQGTHINIDDPIALEGSVPELDASDPLIKKVIENEQAACVTVHQLASQKASDHRALSCIPLLSSDGVLKAILVIYQTDLHNLQQQYLDFMSIMAGWFADQLKLGSVGAEKDKVNESHSLFFYHLRRCIQDAENYGVPSSIVVIKTTNFGLAPALEKDIKNNSEPLEQVLIQVDNDRSIWVICLLMPLQGKALTEHYVTDFPAYLNTQFGLSMETAEVEIDSLDIKPFGHNSDNLDLFFERWGVSGFMKLEGDERLEGREKEHEHGME